MIVASVALKKYASLSFTVDLIRTLNRTVFWFYLRAQLLISIVFPFNFVSLYRSLVFYVLVHVTRRFFSLRHFDQRHGFSLYQSKTGDCPSPPFLTGPTLRSSSFVVLRLGHVIHAQTHINTQTHTNELKPFVTPVAISSLCFTINISNMQLVYKWVHDWTLNI